MMLLYLLSCQTIPSETQKFTEQVEGSTADSGESSFMGEAQILPTNSHEGFHILARYVNEYQSTIGGVRDIGIDFYDVNSLSLLYHLDLQTDAFGYADTIVNVSDIFTDATLQDYTSVYIGLSDMSTSESTSEDTGTSSGGIGTDIAEDQIDSLTKIYYAPPSVDTLLSTTHYLTPELQSPSAILEGYNEYFLVKGRQVYIKGKDVLDSYYLTLETPQNPKGMSTFHIDNDGIDDIVIWDSNHIFLLRGRENGGLTWGSAFVLEDVEISAVSVSDVNSDGKSDITVAFNQDDDGIISVLEGSGNWTFEEQDPFILPYNVQSMISIDEDLDGIPDISLIRSDNHRLERFTKSDLGWINIDNSAANAFDANENAYIAPMQDLNADGRKDLIIVDGVEETGATFSQSIVFITIAEILTKYEMSFDNPVEVLFADLHDDDSINILTMDEEAFKVIGLNEQGSFVSRRIAGFGEKAPFLVEDQNGDGINDLLFAGLHLSRYIGQNEDEDDWRIAKPIFATNTIDANQGILIDNFNEDENIEVLQFSSDSNGLKVKSAQYVFQEETLQLKNYNASQVSSGTEVLDYASCGNQYFGVLIKGAEATTDSNELMVFRLKEDFSFEINSKSGVTGDKIYCKATGENTAVFATLASGFTIGGSVHLFSQGLYEFPTDSLGLPEDTTITWYDIAIGFIEGNDVTGVDIRGCGDIGCEIEMYDLNDNGVDEVIIRNRDKNVSIQSGERIWDVEQKGDIAVRDLNGDGLKELLVYDEESTDGISQYLWVVPVLQNDIGQVYGFRTLSSFSGVPYFEDINFDGEIDVLLPSGGTELSYSVEIR